MKKSFKILVSAIVLIFIAVLIILSSGARFFSDWLWFDNLGFLHTFFVMFFTNFGIRIIMGLFFTLFLYFNLSFTKKPVLMYINTSKSNVESIFGDGDGEILNWLNKKRLNYTYILSSIILGFLFSSIGQNVWQTVLKYFNRSSFDSVDPIFGKDIGFYVFSLPFFELVREMAVVLIMLTLVIVGLIYFLSSGIKSFQEVKIKLTTRAKSHMTILIVVFMFLKAWDYRLEMFNLLYSRRGVAFGASYTDINANLLGLRILLVIAILIGLLFIYSLFKKNYKIILWGLGIWVVVSFIFSSVYPAFVQRFEVEPNEIAREEEYIGHNIDMTLEAYGLDDITRKEFEVKNDLDWDIVEDNRTTIDNIRLWDPRPMRSTYSQLQELRQYYQFMDVDIDRYEIDGEYRQVLLSMREMAPENLPSQAQTWINRTLKYTHGFGMVMSPAGQVTGEGLPNFYIQDIPPKTNTDLELGSTRDLAVYYGENTNNHVIAGTDAKEFHYPLGDKNEFIHYDGTGGVEINSFLRKILYTVRYGDLKIFLNDDINPESRIMYHRNIRERVRKAAPFLSYDADPYPVLHDGKVYWIQDAYTTTDKFPYSEPMANMGNYIRNSVKVVIDAYNGSMDFYIVDDEDPLVQTYNKIFPDLFVSGEEVPEGLREHFRYPEDLFSIQVDIYRTYHMRDPQVFYNQEDVWTVPTETYGQSSVRVEPYYIINKLPGEDEAEFILMQTYTPENRNNMVAWFAARCDGDNYGQLFEYSFPKDRLVYGPRQIESRIDQHSDISQLLSLWSQRGSRVIRGNLLVIPIENSVLYVEPIYIQAETSELPELARVIVAFEDKVVMRPTLDLALAEILGEPDRVVQEEEIIEDIPADPLPGVTDSVREQVQEALDIYKTAQDELQAGNWAVYGELMDELEELLQALNEGEEPLEENFMQ